jgi:hypothetical protein
MRGSTLKREALVFEGKDFRSRGDYGGVFEMNQDPVSSEQNNCGEHQCQKARKCMRHSFPDRGGHMGEEFIVRLPLAYHYVRFPLNAALVALRPGLLDCLSHLACVAYCGCALHALCRLCCFDDAVQATQAACSLRAV